MFYKYRGISNLRFLVEIILDNKLYAASYIEMNDPMEGVYSYRFGELTKEKMRLIRSGQNNTRFCSLSKNKNIDLMWSHYADGHRGIVIGLEVSGCYRIEPIKYGTIPEFKKVIGSDESKIAENILTHKLYVWDYEEEVRVFTNEKFIKIDIKEITLGFKMDEADKSFIRKLVSKVNPEIEVKVSRNRIRAKCM